MLESIADGLWHDQYDLFMPLGVHFRGRMVLARLGDGGLWLWSPIPIHDELAREIEAQGEVAHLVAPNSFHHLHFAAAAERFPNARRWVAPALAKKKPSLEHDQHLGVESPAAWADDFEQHLVGGAPKLDEVVFFHRSSKTLLLTDLVFNILEYKGWLTGLVFRMAGTHKKLAQSRLLRSTIRDREAAAASAEKILGWDVQRVVMAHGEIIEEDAHARLREALAWMLRSS